MLTIRRQFGWLDALLDAPQYQQELQEDDIFRKCYSRIQRVLGPSVRHVYYIVIGLTSIAGVDSVSFRHRPCLDKHGSGGKRQIPDSRKHGI